MACTCLHTNAKFSTLMTYERVKKYDPTRTTSLRNAFAKQMDRRFDALARAVQKKVVEDDVFGLSRPVTHAREFEFLTSPEKVQEFMRWLQEMIDQGILEVTKYSTLGVPTNVAWTDMYISDSYKRGVIRARYELGSAGYAVPSIEAGGGIDISMGTPFHMDRVGLLGIRAYEGLRGITAEMSTIISRILSQGMADGDGPRDLARKMVKVINGAGPDKLGLDITYVTKSGKQVSYWMPGKRRAEILARTEIIRAHHVATIQEYRNWGVEGVNVQAEWKTAGDDRVCEECKSLEGNIYTLDEIEPMIPLHPQCRCLALPIIIKTKTKAI